MFKDAVNASNTTRAATTGRTANGALTHTTTLDPVLDFFAICGSLRGKDASAYMGAFDRAYAANRRLVLQLILWLRDARQGAGERKTTYNILQHLEVTHPADIELIVPVLAEFGRWDDLLVLNTGAARKLAVLAFADALRAGNNLAAKWAPREYKMKRSVISKNGDTVVRGKDVDMSSVANQARSRNNKFARSVAEAMGLQMHEYRKMLSSLSSTVEQAMCAKDWSSIDYSKLPTHAAKQYVGAFTRNDETRYQKYIAALVKGEVKVNASNIMPYDVVRMAKDPDATKKQLAQAMWDAMPNLMGDTDVLPMVDTSGSMSCPAGKEGSMTCMDVAIALGLYCSTKQSGAFKNMWLNFSTTPTLRTLNGSTLQEYLNDMNRHGHDWGYSTNIQSAFDQILKVAIRGKVAPEDMPKVLLIMSDMEFDTAKRGATNHEVMYAKFTAAGYEVPKIVYWNLNARTGNVPVQARDNNTALVSGFNPNVLKAVLTDTPYDPVKIMLDTIDAERYRVFNI